MIRGSALVSGSWLTVRNYGLRVNGKGERAWEVGDELRIMAIGLFWEVEHRY